jgi:transposase
MKTQPCTSYPTDVTDEAWAFVAPSLTLMRPDAPQRIHDPRDVYNALRWIVRAGAPWRMLPHKFPLWEAVYQQTQRWIDGGADEPTTAIFDSRTSQSTPESGARAGYDGAKRRKGSTVHLAVDTLGHVLALCVTPAMGGGTQFRVGGTVPAIGPGL